MNQQEEEKLAIINKYYDCAESVIKEWLAEYFNERIDVLFPDYVDDSDVVGFNFEGKQYDAYLVTIEQNCNNVDDRKTDDKAVINETDKKENTSDKHNKSDDEFEEILTDDSSDKCYVDVRLLEKCEDARKACSLLYDAVSKVFQSVVITMKQEYRERLQCVKISFNNELMAFQFSHYNDLELKLQEANYHVTHIKEFLNKQQEEIKKIVDSRGKELTAEEAKRCSEQKAQLEKKLIDFEIVVSQTTPEMVIERQKAIDELNIYASKLSRLHIAIELADNDLEEHTEAAFKRLPNLGVKFIDPDKEDLVDKIKKEYNIKD